MHTYKGTIKTVAFTYALYPTCNIRSILKFLNVIMVWWLCRRMSFFFRLNAGVEFHNVCSLLSDVSKRKGKCKRPGRMKVNLASVNSYWIYVKGVLVFIVLFFQLFSSLKILKTKMLGTKSPHRVNFNIRMVQLTLFCLIFICNHVFCKRFLNMLYAQ